MIAMKQTTETSANAVGPDLGRCRLTGPLVLRDHQLPAKTLQARDRLIAALRGDDVDEQRKAFEELRRLKLRDIARADTAAAARRPGKRDDSPWQRREP